MDFDISYSKRFDGKTRSVILNCGERIALPDGKTLGNFQSGLYKNIEFRGDRLIVFEIGDTLEVTDKIAKLCKSKWTPVYELFPIEEFKRGDFYRSPTTKLGDFTFGFWYFGEHLPGRIHKDHDFFELHTQILGTGEMQKFRKEDGRTIYDKVRLEPGEIHRPFFDMNRNYPWHRYQAISKSIFLSIESSYPIPRS